MSVFTVSVLAVSVLGWAWSCINVVGATGALSSSQLRRVSGARAADAVVVAGSTVEEVLAVVPLEVVVAVVADQDVRAVVAVEVIVAVATHQAVVLVAAVDTSSPPSPMMIWGWFSAGNTSLPGVP